MEKAVDQYRPVEDAGFTGSPNTVWISCARYGDDGTGREPTGQGADSRQRVQDVSGDVAGGCDTGSFHAPWTRCRRSRDGLELNIGGSTLVRCLSDALSVSVDRLKARYRDVGDMGDVAASCKSHQRVLLAPRPSSISSIYESFLDVARTTGKGSVQSKRLQITRILRGCTKDVETKFVVRTLLSNVRIGANWRSVLPAVGIAAVWHRCAAMNVVPSEDELSLAAGRILQNYCVQPSVSRCCMAALAGDGDETLSLQLGIPFKPMLAKPAGKGVADALTLIAKNFDAAEGVLCENKMDGMRAVVHVDRPEAKVTIFSRNAEDRTSTFGDEVSGSVLDALADHVQTIILDAEVCAITPDGMIDSFQMLSARATNGCSLRLVIFDVVLIDGTCLTDLPLAERRKRLRQVITPSRSIAFAEGCEVSISELGALRLRELLMAALASKAEGLMIKSLSSKYECMQRSTSWLKLKKDYMEDDSELGDTYDCRVIGGWWGQGRKAGWFSPFLVAIYDEDAESWQSLCRVLSGFSNEFYKEATARLSKSVVDAKPFDYDTAESPPVWFETNELWEIRGADLQLSPVHRAAIGSVDDSRGIGLRFPRFVRIRDDKGLEDATTASDIAALYRTN